MPSGDAGLAIDDPNDLASLGLDHNYAVIFVIDEGYRLGIGRPDQ
jgi:hypothetical protein